MTRRSRTLVGILLAAVALATCTDSGVAPSGAHLVRVALRPWFATVSATSAPINRIVITARDVASDEPVGSLDQIVDADAASWELALDVHVDGTETRDVALALELMNSASSEQSVEWSGTVIVPVTPGEESEVEDVPLYPGPLAPVASITLSPSQADLPVGGTLVMTAVVRDKQGNALSRVLTWTSSDTNTAIVSSTGVVNARAMGSATIAATIEGKSDAAAITVYVPGAASIELASGAEQTGTVSTPLLADFVVRVLDQRGNGVAGQSVTWAVTTGGGSIAPDTALTNADGIARATLTLGASIGAQTAEARAEGLAGSPVVFTATAVAALKVASIVVSPASANLVAGDTAAFTAVASDASGAALSDVIFTWRSSDSTIARVSTTGLVTARLAGTAKIIARAGGVADTATVTVKPGVATSLGVYSGNGQSGHAQGALANPIAVIVTDVAGNGIGGVTVTWGVLSGGGSLDVSSAFTDDNGIASAQWTLGAAVGLQHAQAGATGLAHSPVQFEATSSTGAITRTWVGGNASGATNWSLAANWSPVGVPSDVDTAVVPVRANAPRAFGDVTVGTLIVESGATASNGGYTITVNGNLYADGAVTGVGVVLLTGDGVELRGTVENLNITGSATAVGAVTANGDLTVVSGNLTVNGKTITVGGNFKAGEAQGTITMTKAADRLIVRGSIQFANTNETGKLTAGIIQARGDFGNGCYNDTEFVPTGTQVVFDGDGTVQRIEMCSTSAGNRFYDLTVAGGASVVTGDDPIIVKRTLTVGGTLTVEVDGLIDVMGPAGSLIIASGGTLDNQGTVKANLPPTNNGGTITGNAVVQR